MYLGTFLREHLICTNHYNEIRPAPLIKPPVEEINRLQITTKWFTITHRTQKKKKRATKYAKSSNPTPACMHRNLSENVEKLKEKKRKSEKRRTTPHGQTLLCLLLKSHCHFLLLAKIIFKFVCPGIMIKIHWLQAGRLRRGK
jgi:hypothetical protein